NLKFYFIFLDPPYAFSDENELFSVNKEIKLLNENGTIIFEHKSDKPSKEYSGFNLVDSRKYGIATFDFYKENI
ncbi:MAG: RsmD family RNA methyltransferase, partial [Clostridia bacterium]|nr:RsmD family RNA methyltransferase [Clostridia bacterium]